MSDTITIQVNENWRRFYPNDVDSFTFNNQGPNEVYVRESSEQPSPQETGYVYDSGKGGAGEVEASSSFWVRARRYDSIFHYSGLSPVSISDLTLWLDAAEDSCTIHGSGGTAVSQWDDISGNGNNLVQSTGSDQPLTGVNTLNGKNVIAFDGVNHFLEKPSFAASPNITIILVSKVSGAVSEFKSVLTLDGTNNFQIEAGDSSQFLAKFNAIGLGSLDSPFHTSDLLDVPSIINYRLSSNDLKVVLRVNGAQSDDDDYNGLLGATQTLYLGRNRVDNDLLNVDIAEVLIYNRDLALSEMEAIETYLSDKWGIPLV